MSIKILSALLFLSLTSCKTKLSGVLNGSANDMPTVVSIDDGGFTNSVSQSPSISWDTDDSSETSADVSYRYAIGTSPGDDDTIEWTDNGTSTTLNLSSLTLISGQTYYISIIVVAANGNESDPVTSSGFIVDTDNPSATSAPDDGEGVVDLTKTDEISWASASDPTTSISHYEVSIGLTAGAADVVNWTNVGDNTSYQFTGLSLASGTTYFVSVRAVDQAGNTGASMDSDGFIAGGYCANKSAWITYNASGNAGTDADPFEICNAAQLADINSGTEMTSSYILMADIDLAPYYSAPNPQFRIGDTSNEYSGTFDGNGKTISNFSYIDVAAQGVALFSESENGALIKNLTVSNATVSGDSRVGILIGSSNSTTVENVHVSGNLTAVQGDIGGLIGSTFKVHVDHSSADVVVNSGYREVGGLVGDGYHLSVTNSHSAGTINGSNRYLGGLIGIAKHTNISSSYSTADVVNTGQYSGGITGRAENSRISNSYSTGTVSGSYYVGGLVGCHVYDSIIKNSYSTSSATTTNTSAGGLVGSMDTSGRVINSYSTGAVLGNSSSANIGYLIGADSGGTIVNSYYLSTASCDSDGSGGACGTLGSAHGDISVFHSPTNAPMSSWDQVGNASDGTNDFWEFSGSSHAIPWYVNNSEFTAPFTGDGTAASPFLIGSVPDYQLIGQNPRWMNSHFELTGNLDFNGKTYYQIGGVEAPYSGHFDGKDFTISNITHQKPTENFIGTFGVVGPQGGLDNLTVNNVTIEGNGYVGGMAALIDGICTSDTYVGTGTVTGNDDYVGGVFAYHIKACSSRLSSAVNVSGVDHVGGVMAFTIYGNNNNGFSLGTVSGDDYVGGIFGQQRSSGHSFYSRGNVTGTGSAVGGTVGYLNWSTLRDSYATGNVTGVGKVGGAVGWSSNGTFEDSFATGAVNGTNGTTEVGLLVGVDASSTLTNNHYWSGAACDSTGSSGACNAIGSPVATLSDFYNSLNAPLSAWSFPGAWNTTATFPKLSWEP